jgi:hypothetical protein
LSEEWIWAAVICATPFAMFGLVEFAAVLRSRRLKAIARRPKSRGAARPRSSIGRAD